MYSHNGFVTRVIFRSHYCDLSLNALPLTIFLNIRICVLGHARSFFSPIENGVFVHGTNQSRAADDRDLFESVIPIDDLLRVKTGFPVFEIVLAVNPFALQLMY